MGDGLEVGSLGWLPFQKRKISYWSILGPVGWSSCYLRSSQNLLLSLSWQWGFLMSCGHLCLTSSRRNCSVVSESHTPAVSQSLHSFTPSPTVASFSYPKYSGILGALNLYLSKDVSIFSCDYLALVCILLCALKYLLTFSFSFWDRAWAGLELQILLPGLSKAAITACSPCPAQVVFLLMSFENSRNILHVSHWSDMVFANSSSDCRTCLPVFHRGLDSSCFLRVVLTHVRKGFLIFFFF